MARALTILKMSFFSNLKKKWGRINTSCLGDWGQGKEWPMNAWDLVKTHLETRNFIKKWYPSV